MVFNQNHDQIGNRPKGERLCALVDYDRLKIAAAAILLSPYVPMLFMGEEYADFTGGQWMYRKPVFALNDEY